MRKIAFILILFFGITANAQDVHFSQFLANNFALNPARVGMQNNDCKTTLHRKSQWASVSIPFTTFGLALERKEILPSHNIGVQFLNDIAGDSRFKTSGLTIAYAKSVAISKENTFSFGAGLGIFQRSILFDDLVFNETENLNNLNFMFPDLSIGVANENRINKNVVLESGIAFFHINKPKQSFTENDAIRLHQKMNFHTTLNYTYTDNLSIQPKLLFSNQDTDKEFLLGCGVNYLLEGEKEILLKSGIADRFNDALILYFGAEIEGLSCVVSYDVNTSSLTNASNNKGGFEFVLVYQWKSAKKIKIVEQEICPKYL
ncbi:MAG: PorP/SprF family type IX secretion system membrane protein [Flavobacteriales bacterium]|jgi:type IX secretion system PorP/SprF family membrane protein|nr:PorP/SprF family type IX secretion system membrane protein [Flavobacteriales bacterium]MBT5090299.1 PorP/SprF family type IX secretion system membrane protein [Flavobacteriales bacterium]MBT5750842.1 PorP/SprF family type IX secretion system membrane protein [Flavobacteriales bacterium]